MQTPSTVTYQSNSLFDQNKCSQYVLDYLIHFLSLPISLRVIDSIKCNFYTCRPLWNNFLTRHYFILEQTLSRDKTLQASFLPLIIYFKIINHQLKEMWIWYRLPQMTSYRFEEPSSLTTDAFTSSSSSIHKINTLIL